MSGWIKLSEREYKTVWRQFKKKFNFRPSVYKKDWPGIEEPVPSITYDISQIIKLSDKFSLIEDLAKKMVKAFQSITDEGKWIYALDWQHASFKFNPNLSFDKQSGQGVWLIPIYPDGDYYIFLSETQKNGVFGHPWEKTMCIFGDKLVKVILKDPPKMFNRLIRKKNT